MEFIIGNGHVFAEKDVLQAIRELDSESKFIIVETIVYNLIDQVRKAESWDASEGVKVSGQQAKNTLWEINRLLGVIKKG